SDGAELARWGPDADAARDSMCGDPVFGGGPDHELFDRRDILADVLAIRLQVHDRVPDDLPRAVIGDVPAAVRLEQFEAAGCEHLRRPEDVLGLRSASQRDDRRMLEQQQRIGHEALRARLHQKLLHGEPVLVFDAAEAADVQRAGHAEIVVKTTAWRARRVATRAAPRAAPAATRAGSRRRRRRAIRARDRASSPPRRWRRSLPRAPARGARLPGAPSTGPTLAAATAAAPAGRASSTARPPARRGTASGRPTSYARRCGRSRIRPAWGRRRCERGPAPP